MLKTIIGPPDFMLPESVFFSDPGGKVAVDHQMENVVQHTDQQRCTIFRKTGDLNHDGQGQGFLGSHEKNGFPPSPADIKNTGQSVGNAQKNQVEPHHQGKDLPKSGAFGNENLSGS